jgi:hypothetical protein
MKRLRQIAAGAVLFLPATMTAAYVAADPACSEPFLRDRLEVLSKALHQPKAQKALTAAMADYDVDHDFDNLEDGKYLVVALLHHDADRNVNVGNLTRACVLLKENVEMQEAVIAGE